MSQSQDIFIPLRPGLLTSPAFNRLSERAECLFIRLLLVVDDFGIFHAGPELVRAACFPLKSYRTSDVSRALDELENAGMIARYTATDSNRYMALQKHRSRLAKRLARYPQPPSAAVSTPGHSEPAITPLVEQCLQSPPTDENRPAEPVIKIDQINRETPVVKIDQINRQAPLSESKRENQIQNKNKNKTQKETQTQKSAKAEAGQLPLMADDPAAQAKRKLEPPPPGWSPALHEAWQQWLQHRRENKHPRPALAQRQQIAQLAQWPEAQAIANIQHAIRSGWRGIYETRPPGGQFAQRGRPSLAPGEFTTAF